jgi:hypothetical protein
MLHQDVGAKLGFSRVNPAQTEAGHPAANARIDPVSALIRNSNKLLEPARPSNMEDETHPFVANVTFD